MNGEWKPLQVTREKYREKQTKMKIIHRSYVNIVLILWIDLDKWNLNKIYSPKFIQIVARQCFCVFFLIPHPPLKKKITEKSSKEHFENDEFNYLCSVSFTFNIIIYISWSLYQQIHSMRFSPHYNQQSTIINSHMKKLKGEMIHSHTQTQIWHTDNWQLTKGTYHLTMCWM